MKPRDYSPDMVKELEELAKLADIRGMEERLKNLAEVFQVWEAGKLSSEEVEREVLNFQGRSPNTWSEEADPGMPVAEAIAKGYLSKEEISSAAWDVLEVLITLVEL